MGEETLAVAWPLRVLSPCRTVRRLVRLELISRVQWWNAPGIGGVQNISSFYLVFH